MCTLWNSSLQFSSQSYLSSWDKLFWMKLLKAIVQLTHDIQYTYFMNIAFKHMHVYVCFLIK